MRNANYESLIDQHMNTIITNSISVTKHSIDGSANHRSRIPSFASTPDEELIAFSIIQSANFFCGYENALLYGKRTSCVSTMVPRLFLFLGYHAC